MQILVLFAHPRFSASIIQREMLAAVRDLDGITLHDLYATYPQFNIDVKAEQALLLQHDIIVFQHPLYWYSAPAMIKEWLDTVLQYGWAYGSSGSKLAGKFMMQALSTGNMYESDAKGQKTALIEILLPFRNTAHFCGMDWLAPFAISNSTTLGHDDLQTKAKDYRTLLLSLRDGVIDPMTLMCGASRRTMPGEVVTNPLLAPAIAPEREGA